MAAKSRSHDVQAVQHIRRSFVKLFYNFQLFPSKLRLLISRINWGRNLQELGQRITFLFAIVLAVALVVMYAVGVYACFILATKTFSPSWT